MNKKIVLALTIICFYFTTFAQKETPKSKSIFDFKDHGRPILTAVPFLTIVPESRAGGMGDVGVATSADINSMKYNIAKYPFLKSKYGVSFSYTPWLSNLVKDVNLLYLTGYMKIDDKQTLSAALTYFSLGDINFTDKEAQYIKTHRPREISTKLGYSRFLTDKLSIGASLGHIYSNLVEGVSDDIQPGHAFSADMGIFYQNDVNLSGKSGNLALGLSINDLASKISYNSIDKDFVPAKMRLGAALTINLDDYNSIMGSVEFSKLLVPSTPIYYRVNEINEMGDTVRNPYEQIKYGKSSDISSGTAVFQSFYDAPGILGSDGTRSVLKEELQEVMWAVGLEYWYVKQFALRAGYFHEAENKGNRKFFTVGAGLKYNIFQLDFSYLIASGGSNNPLKNILRFSLSFDLAAL